MKIDHAAAKLPIVEAKDTKIGSVYKDESDGTYYLRIELVCLDPQYAGKCMFLVLNGDFMNTVMKMVSDWPLTEVSSDPTIKL